MTDFEPKRANFDSFGAKMGQTEFFCEKAKMSLPYAYYAATLCKKPEQTYERILRSRNNDERTNERTDGRTDEREWIRRSQFRSAGDQKPTKIVIENMHVKTILHIYNNLQ